MVVRKIERLSVSEHGQARVGPFLLSQCDDEPSSADVACSSADLAASGSSEPPPTIHGSGSNASDNEVCVAVLAQDAREKKHLLATISLASGATPAHCGGGWGSCLLIFSSKSPEERQSIALRTQRTPTSGNLRRRMGPPPCVHDPVMPESNNGNGHTAAKTCLFFACSILFIYLYLFLQLLQLCDGSLVPHLCNIGSSLDVVAFDSKISLFFFK